MSARSTLDNTYSAYADRAESGPIDFAGDAQVNAANSAVRAVQPSLLLRAVLVATVLLAAVTAFAAVVNPTKAHLSGTSFQQTIGSGFVQPEQMAIDANGNLYIADVQTNNVTKETLVNGVYTQSIVRANLNGPIGVAVDGNGDVFIANSDSSQVLEEELLPNGSYTEVVLPIHGLGGIVCDLAANKAGSAVFIADCFNNRIVVETVSHGQWAQNVVPTTGLSFPNGVALSPSEQLLFIADGDNNRIVEVDLADNKQTAAVSTGLNSPTQVFAIGSGTPVLFIADTLNSRIVKATYNGTTKAYQTTTVPTGELNAPTGVVADPFGDVFIADTNNKQVVEDTPGMSTDFGPWPVGVKSTAATLTFTFDNGGEIGAPLVSANPGVAQTGTFSSVTGGTCVKGATFATGQTCTIEAVFDASLPGVSFGTAELRDSSNNVLAEAALSGTGVGPEAIYPGNASDNLVGTGLSGPKGVAVDRSGNVYIVDSANDRVLKETLGTSGTYTQTVVAGTGTANALQRPTWVAADSEGDVFVTDDDLGNLAVLEETAPSGTTKTYTQSTICETKSSDLEMGCKSTPGPIVVDSHDNLWIGFNGIVEELTWSPSTGTWKEATQIDVTSRVTIGIQAKDEPLNVTALAVDARGNVFIGAPADATLHTSAQIVEYALQPDGHYVSSVIEEGATPKALAADLMGNLFINGETLEVYVPGQVSTRFEPLSTQTALSGPLGIAVDLNDKVYIANSSVSQVLAETWSNRPSYQFPDTQVDSTSPAVSNTLLNIGNAAVDWTIPSTGQNPVVTSPFEINTDSTDDPCPAFTSASQPDPLLPGSECELGMSYAPTKTGSASGSATYEYEIVSGAASRSLGFSLSGNAIEPVPTINWPTPASIEYGTALSGLQYNATASYNGQTVPGTFIYHPSIGTVLSGGTHVLNVQFIPSSAGFSGASGHVTIQVTPVPLFVVADSFSQTYGSPIPTFTASYIGLVNGDTPSSLDGVPAITTEATPQFPWGYYPITITQGTLSSPNYTLTLVDGTLVITQAPLTVTANNEAVTNGSNIPSPYPCTLTGFVNGDTAAVVSGACATNAQSYSSSPAGSYTVTPTQGTLAALNYYFTNFTPGTLTISESQATIGSGFRQPEGVAVDSNGNVYVTDAEEYYVVKETLASGTFTQSDVGLTPASQFGIAVDGSGNLYVTSSGTNEVWEWTYANGAYTSSVIANSDTGINNPWGIAVDKNGNVYVANMGSSNVIELKPLGGGEFALSTIANSSDQGLYQPEGIAVDANGNVYIADAGNERVVIMNNSGGKYSMSDTVFGPFDQLTGVAVDTSGNVYISAQTESTVYKETLSSGTYTQSAFLSYGLLAPSGVAVDANGNVYIADTGNRRVVEVTALSSQQNATSLAARKISKLK
jgi:sugar lactone lactonase YvrE